MVLEVEEGAAASVAVVVTTPAVEADTAVVDTEVVEEATVSIFIARIHPI